MPTSPTPYQKHTSPIVRCLVANLIALGDAWRGTAPPVRALAWTLTWVLAGAILLVAAWLGVASPPDPVVLWERTMGG